MLCRWAKDLAVAIGNSQQLQADIRSLNDTAHESVLQKARVIGCTTTGVCLTHISWWLVDLFAVITC